MTDESKKVITEALGEGFGNITLEAIIHAELFALAWLLYRPCA